VREEERIKRSRTTSISPEGPTNGEYHRNPAGEGSPEAEERKKSPALSIDGRKTCTKTDEASRTWSGRGRIHDAAEKKNRGAPPWGEKAAAVWFLRLLVPRESMFEGRVSPAKLDDGWAWSARGRGRGKGSRARTRSR